MSIKRPLSPESSLNANHGSQCELKRLKLHALIQRLRHEETTLVIFKKLRASQQLSTQINNSKKPVTNGCHPTSVRSAPSAVKPTPTAVPSTVTNLSVQHQHQHHLPQQHQQSSSATTRKPPSSPLLTSSNQIPKNPSLEEYKTQAKLALRKQLERDLLNISLPKPSLQDIVFIPNGASLEFQPFIGLEDVVQCLSEIQNNRQRLPQRFTDQASVEEPNVCAQCGTDFTIRWWKHSSSKATNQIITTLCDRCKKQVTRKASKSEHSALLKNVFISAMEQEKEIDKHFNALIKQQATISQSSSSKPSTAANARHVQSLTTLPTNHQNQATKSKTSTQPNPFSKVPHQSLSAMNAARKPNVTVPLRSNHPNMKHSNHPQNIHHNKTSMSVHHQTQYRSVTNLTHQSKLNNQIMKVQKTSMKREPNVFPSHSISSNPDLMNSILSGNLVKPTATKRSTFHTVAKK